MERGLDESVQSLQDNLHKTFNSVLSSVIHTFILSVILYSPVLSQISRD